MRNKNKLIPETTTQKPDYGCIKVNILDVESGLLEYENVRAIKIRSKKYQLVIMKDYLSIIGDIEGSIEIEIKSGNIKLENIVGYYMHRHNQFNLFIKEEIVNKI